MDLMIITIYGSVPNAGTKTAYHPTTSITLRKTIAIVRKVNSNKGAIKE